MSTHVLYVRSPPTEVPIDTADLPLAAMQEHTGKSSGNRDSNAGRPRNRLVPCRLSYVAAGRPAGGGGSDAAFVGKFVPSLLTEISATLWRKSMKFRTRKMAHMLTRHSSAAVLLPPPTTTSFLSKAYQHTAAESHEYRCRFVTRWQ